jgi:hypothetical protein
MAEFGLKKSFNIDNGELDGLTPQECFVLGYELAEIDTLLLRPGAIDRPVHTQNRERILKSCQDADRPGQMLWLAGDVSESWQRLLVPERQRTNDQRTGL